MIFQFLLTGAASIYYGDEAEIDGTIDTIEGCRYPMPWGKDIHSCDAYRLHQTMCRLKAENKALSHGSMKFLYAQNNVIAIARFWEDQVFVGVISTNGEDQTIRMPLGAVGAVCPEEEQDLFGKELQFTIGENSVELQVKAHEALLFRCNMK